MEERNGETDRGVRRPCERQRATERVRDTEIETENDRRRDRKTDWERNKRDRE